MSSKLYEIPVRRNDSTETSLQEYSGKVLLIVNVASKCGLTPQYEALESVYEKYRARGLEILAFPANEFAGQEPGTDAEIKDFCQTQFGVKFPLFSKIVVKGAKQHPLYQYLTQLMPAAQVKPDSVLKAKLKDKGLLTGGPSDITWNFEKFLVDRQGSVVARFAPDMAPDDRLITSAIEAQLN
jgi:glutathione peroxidase